MHYFKAFWEDFFKGIAFEERQYSEEASLETIWRRAFQTEETVSAKAIG